MGSAAATAGADPGASESVSPILRLQANTFARFVPPPRLELGAWMEAEMRLPASASALPGRIHLHKWQRGLAAAISDPTIRRVSVQKSARVGYTTILVGAIGSTVANEPAPTLVVLPTEADARAFMVDNLEPTFTATPALRKALADDQDEAGRNTLLAKRYPGGSLTLAAARSPRNLRAKTAKNVFFDEVDGMEVTAEGDPIDLGIMRSQTYAQRKIIMGSTPVFQETSRIIRAYDEGDGRVFEVPCPECGERNEIRWAHIEWETDKPETAAYRCPHCAALVPERFKAQMVEAGDWKITRPHVRGHASFRINSLVSLLPNTSWATLAAEFLRAKKSPDTLQAFVNTVLGEGWRETAEELDESELQSRVEEFGLQSIPSEVRVVTAGLDVQRDRVEITFLGFTANVAETLVLGHAVIWGDPKDNTTWAEVDDALRSRWKHPLGGEIGVDAAAVDAGDGETMDYVLQFCRPRFARRVVAIKGAAGNRPAIEASHSKGSKLFIVGVDGLKARLLTQLSKSRTWRFSNSLGAVWFEQLTSERRVLRYSRGQPVRSFERIMGRRAEALDCTIYALAARNLVNLDLTRRENELRQIAKPPQRVSTVIRSKWLEGER
ncbi:MAG: phage terminase large subunit family protein [Hyphomonadaceae bacterium]